MLLCRPTKLVLFELSELALYNADMEIRQLAEGSDIEIVSVLGTVTDTRQLRKVLSQHGVNVVLHAAAYKHVPLVEANPLSGLVNNVLGTHALAEQAARAGWSVSSSYLPTRPCARPISWEGPSGLPNSSFRIWRANMAARAVSSSPWSDLAMFWDPPGQSCHCSKSRSAAVAR